MTAFVETTNSSIIECPNKGCGGEMHISMDECGDCMNEDSFFISRGQRVLTTTRRTFNHGN